MNLKTTVGAVLCAALAGAVVTLSPSPAGAVGTTPRNCAQPNGRVTSVAVSGTTAYIGGDFTAVRDANGVTRVRSRLAAINTSTCALYSWAPAANATVNAISVYGDRVFVGGDFTSINGVARGRLALLSASTGTVTSFNPNLNRSVKALGIGNGRLYAGGDFTQVGATTRNRLAAFWFGSLALDASWRPSASARVSTLGVTTSRIYVGGRFASINANASTTYLAAVNPATGVVDSGFLPRPGWPVNTVLAYGSTLYGGGEGAGGRIGMWGSTGAALRPYHVLDGGVAALGIDGTSLYVGGHFTNYCKDGTGSGAPFKCSRPLERRKALQVNLSTGAVGSWAPQFDSPLGVFAMRFDSTTRLLWIGGDFTRIGTRPVSRLAVLS